MNTDLFSNCITRTDVAGFSVYRGKVRDVYELPNQTLALVATDRISAFDHILKEPIPYKGQILNTLAAYFFEHVSDIVATQQIAVPHPNIAIVKKCEQIPVEVVVRGFLTGHAWRTYTSGGRILCGVSLPENMIENQRFIKPIITPTTKAHEGHDEDISEIDLLNRGLVNEALWKKVTEKALQLFERGSQMAEKQGLYLVDTKYEFGLHHNELTLTDEVHTADSSRYFYKDDYDIHFGTNIKPKQLSKEFVREWLMKHQFQGKEGQILPTLPDDFRIEVMERYQKLYEILTSNAFIPTSTAGFDETLSKILHDFSQ